MKTIYSLLFISLISFSFSASSFAQAIDFQANDCNGNPQHLFADLDAGQAVVLFFYMPSCGTCPPPAQKIQAMADKINQNCPGMVKGYAYSYQNSTTCNYTASWVTSNNLPLYAPMDGNGAEQVAYYGGFGMPTVVLLGGTNHDILWSTQNFVTSDTTAMRDLILNMNCVAGLNDLNNSQSSLTVYPNPSSHNWEVKSNAIKGDYKVIVTSLIGEVVYENQGNSLNNETTISIPTMDFIEGIYLLKIQTEKQEFQTKLMKTN